MTNMTTVVVPDIGDFDSVEVIEVLREVAAIRIRLSHASQGLLRQHRHNAQ